MEQKTIIRNIRILTDSRWVENIVEKTGSRHSKTAPSLLLPTTDEENLETIEK